MLDYSRQAPRGAGRNDYFAVPVNQAEAENVRQMAHKLGIDEGSVFRLAAAQFSDTIAKLRPHPMDDPDTARLLSFK